MIWWPFNLKGKGKTRSVRVVTHQWSGDPSIASASSDSIAWAVVTHQWSGDPSIAQALESELLDIMS